MLFIRHKWKGARRARAVLVFDDFFSGFRAKFQKIVTCAAFSIKFAKTNQKFAENSEFCENYSLLFKIIHWCPQVYIIEDVHRDERSRRVFDYVTELEAKFVRLVDFRSPTLYARKTSMDAHRYEMQDMDWRYHISSVHTYAHCIVIKKSVTCITRESSRSGSETVQEPCRFSRTR